MDMSASKGGASVLYYDVLHNIFERLPARSFSMASCVCKTWNSVCYRVLSRPKFASAVSLNPSLDLAVEEVILKVLSKPIRPHFAIAYISSSFNMKRTQLLIMNALGSRIPIITNLARGIIGTDALTDQVKEVNWEYDDPEYNSYIQANKGIVLSVGFLPGFKVDAISLLRPKGFHRSEELIDKFIMDIKNYTVSVSGSESPACIIMFGDQHVDVKPIIQQLDSAMSKETVIVGDARGCFLGKSGRESYSYMCWCSLDAIALVLAKDKHKAQGVGETYFHLTQSTGIIPFGPPMKAHRTSVQGSHFTGIYALPEGNNQSFYRPPTILEALQAKLGEGVHTDLFIKVREKTGHAIDSIKLDASENFYKVNGIGAGRVFYIDGVGVNPGDSLIFYRSDYETAMSSLSNVSKDLAKLKPNRRVRRQRGEVFGGLIFSSQYRGESFNGSPNVNTRPFTVNFPGVSMAGIFCDGEISRGWSRSIRCVEGEEEEDSVHHCSHVYTFSTVYLVMSHIPAPME